MTAAIVIGAGLGGLALGIRLQAAGVATTIVETHDAPGGRARRRQRDGFTFDACPALVTLPDRLRELWALSGRDMDAAVTLDPVAPFHRLHWSDGTTFDHAGDDAGLIAEIARIAPEDVAGYRDFMEYAAAIEAENDGRRGGGAFLDILSMAKAAPALAKYEAWRSVHSIVSKFVRNEKLREALSFHTLAIGGNPMTASAIHAPLHKAERDGALWFVRGGAHRLAEAMAAEFARLGGTLRLGDRAVRIDTLGDHVTGVTTASGWHGEADAVAANSDVIHAYRDLLAESRSAQRTGARLQRKRWTPSLFAVDFGIKGAWPGIPHHSVLFGPRYAALFTDIHEHGVLSRDMVIQLHHPTVTDPGLAPEGHSAFKAVIAVPHLGKFPVDWAEIGPIVERRILDEIGRRLIPDIHERIVARASTMPSDLARDFNAHLGSAFGLEPVPAQSGYFRVHNRDPHIANLYFVGAGTQPGAGLPGVIASAAITAALMLEKK